MNNGELRRPNKVVRFKPVDPMSVPVTTEDSIPEYMNVLGMIFSMCGLMMRLKCVLGSLFYAHVSVLPMSELTMMLSKSSAVLCCPYQQL
uniref:Protein Asterix n=1 Tax=Ditylenchus dipsaci TaxID=166011 RepID=A0A915D7R4_9BILA